jgi:Cupin-like domain
MNIVANRTDCIQLNTSIDSIENITKEDFQKSYMIPQKPVIIRHLYGENAKVYSWSFDFFAKELGQIEVGIFDDESTKRNEGKSYKGSNLKMKFRDYLTLIQTKPTTKRLFLFNVFKHKKELLNDFVFPDIAKNVFRFLPLAFFGGQGAITRIHRDMDNSCVFLTELVGYKRVVLFSPKYSKLLYQFPFTSHTSVDINRADYQQFPALKYVKGIDCTIGPGDTIFIPAGWWHHIEYKTPGLGFAIRSLSPHFMDRLLGIYQIGMMTHIDELFHKISPQNYHLWKSKIAQKRAKTAIAKITNISNQ